MTYPDADENAVTAADENAAGAAGEGGQAIAQAQTGLLCDAGRFGVQVPPFRLGRGQVAVLEPSIDRADAELSASLSRVLTTLQPPVQGALWLFGRAVAGLPYVEVLRARQRLGWVPDRGGLLSNRSLRDNIALPVVTHARLSAAEEQERVQALVDQFNLQQVAERRPHEVDGAARFRACAARAVALDPQWLVIEGVGDFEPAAGLSATWRLLLGHDEGKSRAVAVCLSRPNSAFARTMLALGGQVLACAASGVSGGYEPV